MANMSRWNQVSFLVVLAFCTALTVGIAEPQEKPATKAAAAKKAAKPRGRLPAYYKDVVDNIQRDKIYAIQSDFNARIAALEEQLKTLLAERDLAVENVLSEEQKGKVKKSREDAAAKRKKPAAETEETAKTE